MGVDTVVAEAMVVVGEEEDVEPLEISQVVL
jgi:hypothetical protein